MTWPVGFERQQVNGSGSQAPRLSGLRMVPAQQLDPGVTQNCRTGEDSAKAIKSLPIDSSMSAHGGIMAVPSVSTPNKISWQNPSSMVLPSTGMGLQWGSLDLTAPQVMGSSNMPQQ